MKNILLIPTSVTLIFLATVSFAQDLPMPEPIPLPPIKAAPILIDTSSLIRHPASLKTAILRMAITKGVKDHELLFDAPDLIPKGRDRSRYVFSNPRYTYKTPPPNIVNNTEANWIFSGNWQIDKIGTNSADQKGNEVIAFLPHVTIEACIKINNQLGIKEPINDIDGDKVSGANTTDFIPQKSDNMTSNNPGINKKRGVIAGTYSAQPFGCFDSSDKNGIKGDGPYVYYHTLSEN
jgi:hypothetical protein